MEKVFYDTQVKQGEKHWWSLGRKQLILNILSGFKRNKQRKPQILDIGCGMGLMLKTLSRFGDNVYGTDMEDTAVDYCRENCNCTVEKGYLPDNLPFEGKKFDFITCLDVIEHVDDDARCIRAICEKCSKNATVVIAVPAYQFMWSYADVLAHHKRRYNKRQLVKLLSRNGLVIKKISYFNTFLFLPILIVRKLQNALDIKVNDFDLTPEPLNTILKWIFSAEISLLKKTNFPFGVSIIAVCKPRRKRGLI